MLHVFKAAQEVGNYAEVPVLPAKVDPQVFMSRNWVAQPFHLICGKDTVIVQMSGTAEIYFKNSSVNRFHMTVGDHVYVPAGTPHRIMPSEEGVQIRYKAVSAELEGVAFYCPGCDRELRRVEWDTAQTVSQQAYHDACLAFNDDDTRRRCPDCGAQHPRIDMEPFTGWQPLAEQLRGELLTS